MTVSDDRTSSRRSAWGLSSGNHTEPWWDRALCLEVGSELFFLEKGESAKPAKQVCAMCEVRTECLEDALKHGDRFGVRGGMSERERLALMRGQPVTPCRRCGTEFVARAPSGDQVRLRRYCSDECRREAHKDAKRAYQERRREGAA